MSGILQTSEGENRSKRDNERQSRRSSTSCLREGKNWNMERTFFSCAKRSTASVSNESALLSASPECTVVTFVSDEKIPPFLIGAEPEPFQMDEFESDYDKTESEEIVEHRNTITRSGRQIKASVRFDL